MQARSRILLITGIVLTFSNAFAVLSILRFLSVWMYLWSNWFHFLTEISAITASLIAGIAGIRNWKKPNKANTCLTLGIISFGISMISRLVGWIDPSIEIVSIPLSIVLQVTFIGVHVAYIAAAHRLVKSLGDIS